MSASSRDPLQKFSVIDGPLQGKDFAHADDHFYFAMILSPGLVTEPGADARVLYRLRRLEDDSQVWSVASE